MSAASARVARHVERIREAAGKPPVRRLPACGKEGGCTVCDGGTWNCPVWAYRPHTLGPDCWCLLPGVSLDCHMSWWVKQVRWGRHARSKDWWDAPGGRHAELEDAVRDDPEPAPRGKRRRDTRSWCRGKEGRPHTPVLQVWHGKCQWSVGYTRVSGSYQAQARWHCGHREVCTVCGKVLREAWDLRDSECPDFPGRPAERQAAEDRAAEAGRPRRWHRWKPPVTGPQHYRRPKGGG